MMIGNDNECLHCSARRSFGDNLMTLNHRDGVHWMTCHKCDERARWDDREKDKVYRDWPRPPAPPAPPPAPQVGAVPTTFLGWVAMILCASIVAAVIRVALGI